MPVSIHLSALESILRIWKNYPLCITKNNVKANLLIKNKEQVTIFCFEHPSMLKGKILHTASGLYHLESDTIYIFLCSPFNWSPEGDIDTLIHEDCERAIQRIFWDYYIKAAGWTHLFIEIAKKVNEIQFPSKPKKISNVYKFLL